MIENKTKQVETSRIYNICAGLFAFTVHDVDQSTCQVATCYFTNQHSNRHTNGYVTVIIITHAHTQSHRE